MRLEKRYYDPAQDAVRVSRIAQLWERLPEITPPQNAPRPIFIVGMPRSGTTLLESVLGAHSRVFACGERPAMRQILRWPIGARTERQPEDDERTLRELGEGLFPRPAEPGAARTTSPTGIPAISRQQG